MARVIKTTATYSKKKGAYSRGYIELKDVTVEEAVDYVLKNYSKTLTKENPKATISGLLYPGSIEIQGWNEKKAKAIVKLKKAAVSKIAATIISLEELEAKSYQQLAKELKETTGEIFIGMSKAIIIEKLHAHNIM